MVVSKPELKKVKAQLMSPKSANKVIAQLRALPVTDEKDPLPRGPIHAVCLEYTETEAERCHFANLEVLESGSGDDANASAGPASADTTGSPNVANASVIALTKMFGNMRLVSLVKTPDLGLGRPGDGDGLLAGAMPTAETVINGFKQITPQLMALGFATGRTIVVDHKGA
jgi:hypothetical protein